MATIPVFLPEESHGELQSMGLKELYTIEQLNTHTYVPSLLNSPPIFHSIPAL